MDEALVQEKQKNKHISTTLGMGVIGDSCPRKLWLNYHTDLAQDNISAKGYRIFDTGDFIEARIVRDLRRAGIKVNRSKKANRHLGLEGKFKGYSDGIVHGLPESKVRHIFEAKSASDKNFKIFKKEGVAGHKIYGDKYMGQITCYMGFSKIERTLYIIENKDTSERHMERIHFDPELFKRLVTKAWAIIEATTPPSGISDRPDWYECKFCAHNNEESCRKDWGTSW
jgi:hypothetical protein